MESASALFADYDNDGFKDFFVSRTFKPNQLFHNNGDGTFTDVTKKSGIGEDCCTTVASWADYDNDGYLDLYVGRYLDPRTRYPDHILCAQRPAESALSQQRRRHVHQRDGEGRRGRDGAVPGHGLGRLRRRRLSRICTSSTTSAARRCITTTATARSPTSRSRRGTLAYGAGMSASHGRLRQRRQARHLLSRTSARKTRGTPSRRR